MSSSPLQDDNEVIISIKPKARQSSKSCIIKTQERNSAGQCFSVFLWSGLVTDLCLQVCTRPGISSSSWTARESR